MHKVFAIMEVTVLFVNATKNIIIQSKRLWNKKLYTVLRQYFQLLIWDKQD